MIKSQVQLKNGFKPKFSANSGYSKIQFWELNLSLVDRVCSLLNEFQGFDAKGYFTLNHSLLTAMAANFTTYLVILIQFKGSEVESVMETHNKN